MRSDALEDVPMQFGTTDEVDREAWSPNVQPSSAACSTAVGSTYVTVSMARHMHLPLRAPALAKAVDLDGR